MTKKYTSPEEDQKIKDLYLTGKYSYEQIGQMYHVSKPTIINICRNYPWAGDKVEYWRRVYRETVTNMDQVLADIRNDILDSLVKHDSIGYNVSMRQEEYLLSFALTDPEELYEKLKVGRNEVEQTAWGHLSESDYTEFAYFENLWHQINKIIGDNRKNPWGELVEKTGARGRAKSVKYFSNKDFSKYRDKSHYLIQGDYIISDEPYKEVEKLVVNSGRGCPRSKPKLMLSGILYLFQTGLSPAYLPSRYGLRQKVYQYYSMWYRSGLFRILWEVNEKYTELQPIRAALMMIERHRMIDPINPPRFKEVQEANRREKEDEDHIETIE